MKKVAILYDFDKTLCTKDMQEYSLIPSLGYDNPSHFWQEVTTLSKDSNMDGICAYLYLLVQKFRESGRELKRSDFSNLGKSIILYLGVDTWFDRINEYGKKCNLEVEHYIISSGMKEIIESSVIANQFRKIYACRYYYDQNDIAQWPAVIVNYTTKTQYIFRINKQVLDENNDNDLNAFVERNSRPIPFSRMIYIADGITDIPCMGLVKAYHGKSIAVYNPTSTKAKEIASNLIRDGRADFMAEADYRENKRMEQVVKLILEHIKADIELEELEGKYE